MKFATIQEGGAGRDGHAVLVSGDNTKVALLPDGLSTLQLILDNWDKLLPQLEEIDQKFSEGAWEDIRDSNEVKFLAPLPRAYAFLDGSAFIQHILLVRKARGAEPPENLYTVPLMYQGASDCFLAPKEDIPLIDEEYGLDFEAELAVVVGDVPQGINAGQADKYIRLFVILNDISLRNLIPADIKTGFGFLHGKPNSSMAPFAVTVDELGDYWKDGRVHLDMVTHLNGKLFGHPNAGEMHFSFYELIAHAARTRPLTAGTIIGSGTVSNKDPQVGSSCLAEKRMLEKIESGEITTPFLKSGDRIEIEMVKDNHSLFGKISQKVRNINTDQLPG
ncbi:MAG: FAA hydrolase family protein [Candidatus Dadabacteria bacterium]|nr:MAG: FAA hydrolase family protein [Candidatus Dadabacteria bacterium]